jgi:hypothetical protein
MDEELGDFTVSEGHGHPLVPLITIGVCHSCLCGPKLALNINISFVWMCGIRSNANNFVQVEALMHKRNFMKDVIALPMITYKGKFQYFFKCIFY